MLILSEIKNNNAKCHKGVKNYFEGQSESKLKQMKHQGYIVEKPPEYKIYNKMLIFFCTKKDNYMAH
jgi:hypothetical protein